MRDELLSAGEVARRLGIAVTTLRTWHQRYDLGPSHHHSGRHRRYTPADLARLETMRRLTSQGIPAAAAAAAAMATDPQSAEPPAAPDDAAEERAGGGYAIPVGRAGARARGLARAAMRLDHAAMLSTLGAAVASAGVVSTWDTLVCPVLRGIGTRHARTRNLVDVEHLLSRCVSETLATVPRPTAAHPVAVLLACADEEQHSLPLEALAAALAERGTPSRLLGARVPPSALLAAVRRTGPRVVLIWSHTPATADAAALLALLDLCPPPHTVAAAGPGWRPEELPGAVHTPVTLSEAVRLVELG